MKKMLLIPALLGTLAFAAEYKYEISPMIGLNFAEGNLGIEDDINNGGYPVFGLEVQANTPGSKLSPELSVFYSEGVDYVNGTDTKVARGAFNGVYTFDKQGSVTPFVKAGAGYEEVGEEKGKNESGFFLDAGAGIKVALMDQLALKLEAIYMAKPNTQNAGFADSNLLTMAGLSYSFGEVPQKPAPVVEKPAPAPVVAKPVPVAAPVVVDNDTDKDGVVNAKDECPKTPLGAEVNEFGCAIKAALQINFEYDSFAVTSNSDTELQTYANFLNLHKDHSAKIVGYTDSKGSDAYNQVLSEKRAHAVVAELKKRGVDSKQLSASGKGEANPVASNMTAEGRAANRRIEAELTKH